MKKTASILLILTVVISLQSCFVNRYQKVQTTWEKAKPNTAQYITPDSMLNVSYSMWNTYGSIVTEIQNRTDSAIYINPWYTFEIAQKSDTNFLISANQLLIKKNNGSTYLNYETLDEMLYYGDEIPIPPKGEMEIKSACINCYLQLDYINNDPASNRDSITYSVQNTPFLYERRIGYAFPSDTNLRVIRHAAYVSKIDRYKFVWSIDDIPVNQKEDRAFFVHSQRPSVITWFGMIGAGVVYVLGQLSSEEE